MSIVAMRALASGQVYAYHGYQICVLTRVQAPGRFAHWRVSLRHPKCHAIAFTTVVGNTPDQILSQLRDKIELHNC